MFYCIFINNIFALWDFDKTFAKNIKNNKKDTLKIWFVKKPNCNYVTKFLENSVDKGKNKKIPKKYTRKKWF